MAKEDSQEAQETVALRGFYRPMADPELLEILKKDGIEPKSATVERQLERLSEIIATQREELQQERKHIEGLYKRIDQCNEEIKILRDENESMVAISGIGLTSKYTMNHRAMPLKAICDDLAPQQIPEGEHRKHPAVLQDSRTNLVIQQYEQHLSKLRATNDNRFLALKESTIYQVEHLISQYKELAEDAVGVAHAERRRLQLERLKARKLAEAACDKFEHDVKSRMQDVLEDYRSFARSCHESAQNERVKIQNKCTELEQQIEQERQNFECKTFQEAEKYVSKHKQAMQRLQQQRKLELENFCAILDELGERVIVECHNFEERMISSVVQLFLLNGIDMTAAKLRLFLRDSYEQFLEDAEAGQEVCSEEDISKKLASNPLVVRYGITTLNGPGSGVNKEHE